MLFCCGKVSRPSRPSGETPGTPGERAPTRLGVSASYMTPGVLLARVRARHVVTTVKLAALTRSGRFNNMRYKERRNKVLPETWGVRES